MQLTVTREESMLRVEPLACRLASALTAVFIGSAARHSVEQADHPLLAQVARQPLQEVAIQMGDELGSVRHLAATRKSRLNIEVSYGSTVDGK